MTIRGEKITQKDMDIIANYMNDEIHDQDGNYIGEVSEIGNNTVTVEGGYVR